MKFPIALATCAVLLVGCGNVQTGNDGAGSGTGSDSVSRAQLPLGLGCGWQAMSDVDTANIAFPDESATYWVALVPNVPGTRLRIDGRYPDARYFSFNAYDPIIRPVDAIADYQINPNQVDENPFQTPSAAPGHGYTAYVAFTAKPDQPDSNTLYAGTTTLNGQTLPDLALTPVIYRVYVPATNVGLDGGVGLPVLTLETANGDQQLVPYADCTSPLLPNLGDNLPDPGLNALLLGIDYPASLGLVRFPTATYPPTTAVFYGLPDTLVHIANNASPTTLPDQLQSTTIGSGGGFLSNQHNAYTSTAFSRNDGNLFILRGRAPTYSGDSRLAGANEDLRYWSLCQNEFVTQRYVACSADYQTVLDSKGFYTIVVSDAAERPSNAVADNAMTWLPWGPYPDGLLIYRQMLPAPFFTPAIANVPQGTDPETVMGDYLPVGAYCTRDVFESAGNDPEAVFAACLKETNSSNAGDLWLGVVPTP